jgi:hypothetical protein
MLLEAVFKELALVLGLSASRLLEEHLNAKAFFFFSLLLVLGSLVIIQNSFDLVLREETDTLI